MNAFIIYQWAFFDFLSLLLAADILRRRRLLRPVESCGEMERSRRELRTVDSESLEIFSAFLRALRRSLQPSYLEAGLVPPRDAADWVGSGLGSSWTGSLGGVCLRGWRLLALGFWSWTVALVSMPCSKRTCWRWRVMDICRNTSASSMLEGMLPSSRN